MHNINVNVVRCTEKNSFIYQFQLLIYNSYNREFKIDSLIPTSSLFLQNLGAVKNDVTSFIPLTIAFHVRGYFPCYIKVHRMDILNALLC